MAASVLNFNLVRCFSTSTLSQTRLFLNDGQKISDLSDAKRNQLDDVLGTKKTSNKLWVLAATKNSKKSEENVPDWAKPGSDEPPPWAKDEANATSSSQESIEIPFFVYLLASAITAIAAIGSIFEYVNNKPVFGILSSDSIFYTPLLGFFVFTGVPTSAFLWFKSVQTANKEAEEQDRRDGFK